MTFRVDEGHRARKDGGVAKIPITGDPDADLLLEEEPLALLLGMLLDQHMQ